MTTSTVIRPIARVNDLRVICGHIAISMLWGSMMYYVKLCGEDLSHCLNKIEILVRLSWGHNLSKKQSSQLESIQKRAIHIMYQVTWHTPYDSLLYYSNITSLQDRCSQQAKFLHINFEPIFMHRSAPPAATWRCCYFEVAFGIQIPFAACQANQFQSFLNCGLRWYQQALDQCCFCELCFTVWTASVCSNVAVC